MNIKELNNLKNKITKLNALNVIFLIINIFLIVLPFVHYYSSGFKFDTYFIIITLLNIVAFYISYFITNRLVFLKNKHRHFTDKLTNTEQLYDK